MRTVQHSGSIADRLAALSPATEPSTAPDAKGFPHFADGALLAVGSTGGSKSGLRFAFGSGLDDSETPSRSSGKTVDAAQGLDVKRRVAEPQRQSAPVGPRAGQPIEHVGTVEVTPADEKLKLYFDTRSLNAPLANPVHQASFDYIVPPQKIEGALFPLRIEPRHRLGELSAILVSGLPEGSVLSAGTRVSSTAWGLLPDQLDDLRIWLGETSGRLVKLTVRVFQPNGMLAGQTQLRMRRSNIYPVGGPLPRPRTKDVLAKRTVDGEIITGTMQAQTALHGEEIIQLG